MNEIWLDEVDSTNKYALEHFEELSNASLVLAEKQTAGRGRLGRKWLSPQEGNIYASFLLKEYPFPPCGASWLGSLAALKSLRNLELGLDLWLKWPNDIYCGMKKISGMLCETKTDSSNKINGIVIGLGINLNMSSETLNKIDRPATSVIVESGEKVNLKFFANSLAMCLYELYINCFSMGVEVLYREWKDENILIGKSVEVEVGNNKLVRGMISDLGPQGELILETDNGIKSLFSGDVSVKSFENFATGR